MIALRAVIPTFSLPRPVWFCGVVRHALRSTYLYAGRGALDSGLAAA